MRVSGEGVGLLESTFNVTGNFCLMQLAFVVLHRIYQHVICKLSYDWPVVRLISFFHEEINSSLNAPCFRSSGPLYRWARVGQ